MTTSNENAPLSTATPPWRSPWPVTVLLTAVTLSSLLLDHRSGAQADDVRWILAPTVSLASLGTGETFEWERGSGYLHRPTNVTITEGCSGLGFLAVCLVLIVARGAWHARSWQTAWRSLAGGCMAAAVIALITNATRIGLALQLAQADLTPWKLSFSQAHELESRIVYGTALVFLVLGLSWRTTRSEPRAAAEVQASSMTVSSVETVGTGSSLPFGSSGPVAIAIDGVGLLGSELDGVAGGPAHRASAVDDPGL